MISYIISYVYDFVCLVYDIVYDLLVCCHKYISYGKDFEILYEIICI